MDRIAAERGFRALAYGEETRMTRSRCGPAPAPPGNSRCWRHCGWSVSRRRKFVSSQMRLGLPTADLPAQPCLSSRIPHGTPVTTAALEMIEQAEEYVRSSGFSIFRVRYLGHPNHSPSAKLQVDPLEMDKLLTVEAQLREAMRAIGFHDLVIDPGGYLAPGEVQNGRSESSDVPAAG